MGNISSCFQADFGLRGAIAGAPSTNRDLWFSDFPWARRPTGFVDYTEPFQRINGRLRTGRTLAVAPNTPLQRALRDAFDALGLGTETDPLTPQRLTRIFVLGDSAAELGAIETLARHGLISLTRPLRMNVPDGQFAHTAIAKSLNNHPNLLTFMAACGTDPSGTGGTSLAERFGMLQSLGIDLDTPNRDGLTPMHIAAQTGNTLAIHALAAVGADLESLNRGGLTPLILAAQLNHAQAVAALVACGAAVERPGTAFRARAAHWAALENAAEVLHVLGAAGADLNARAAGGATPLHIAAGRGREDAIRALAQLECDLEARTTPEKFELTPIGFSALHGQAGSIRTLASLGAQLDAPGILGRAPIHVAALQNNRATVSALSEAGCNLDAQDIQGNTALHLAALRDAEQAGDALILAGAKLNVRNHNRSRPVDIAGNASNPLMFRRLIDAGAAGPHHYVPGHPTGGI